MANGVGNGGELILRPFIPNLTVDLSMFAHVSTFANGATTMNINTDQFEKVYDPVTAEFIAVLRLSIEMPQGENSFCFNYAIDQHSSHGSPVAATITVNEVVYMLWAEPVIVPIGVTGLTLNVNTYSTTGDPLSVAGFSADGPRITDGDRFVIDNESHPYYLVFSAGDKTGHFNMSWIAGNEEVTTKDDITVVGVDHLEYNGRALEKNKTVYVPEDTIAQFTAVSTNGYPWPKYNPEWKGASKDGDNTATLSTKTRPTEVEVSCGSSSVMVNVTAKAMLVSVTLDRPVLFNYSSKKVTATAETDPQNTQVDWSIDGFGNFINNNGLITTGMTPGEYSVTAKLGYTSQSKSATLTIKDTHVDLTPKGLTFDYDPGVVPNAPINTTEILEFLNDIGNVLLSASGLKTDLLNFKGKAETIRDITQSYYDGGFVSVFEVKSNLEDISKTVTILSKQENALEGSIGSLKSPFTSLRHRPKNITKTVKLTIDAPDEEFSFSITQKNRYSGSTLLPDLLSISPTQGIFTGSVELTVVSLGPLGSGTIEASVNNRAAATLPFTVTGLTKSQMLNNLDIANKAVQTELDTVEKSLDAISSIAGTIVLILGAIAILIGLIMGGPAGLIIALLLAGILTFKIISTLSDGAALIVKTFNTYKKSTNEDYLRLKKQIEEEY